MRSGGGITRRSGDRKPEKNLYSHTHDALAHAISGQDRQARTERRQAGLGQEPPRTLVGERLDG